MKRKPILLGVGVVVLIGVIGLGVVFYALWVRPLFDRVDFVQDAWLRGDVRTRGRMVHDLVDRRLLDGMARYDVVALLGAPDRSSTEVVCYTVDIGEKFGSDPWTYQLSIRLDDSGQVKEYSLHD